MNLHDKLIMAVTEYDRHEEKMALKNPRRSHNPYALAHYCRAVGEIIAEVEQGVDVETAICNNTLGRLQTVCLKAARK